MFHANTMKISEKLSKWNLLKPGFTVPTLHSTRLFSAIYTMEKKKKKKKKIAIL